ncbi:PTS glucose transporter subunit IIA [Mycoplasma elephantis]|uniref:PTS glucose transporter subunit IIA n=1 Tax=Mycoplasma elephantis TaxID=114882 RepID=UPI000486C8B3|nr:PTS glucose transporter subunit IIA [Mycoplasma elephantis]
MTRDEKIKLIKALGGFENILLMSNCATKLRYDILNKEDINLDLIKELNPNNIELIGQNHIQIDFGDDAEQINIEIQNIKINENVKIDKFNKNKENLLKNNKKLHKYRCNNIIYSTNKGISIPLSNLNDDSFSKSLLGRGYAIKVDEFKSINIHAPVSGEVIFIYPSKHAYGIKTKFGNEVLVHIGIGLGKYNGIGIESFVKIGQNVNHGDKIAHLDIEKLKKFNDKSLRFEIITVLTDPVRKYTNFELLLDKINKPNLPWFRI